MARINSNYLKLPGSYLFAEMKRKTDAYKAAHPEADIIRLGIGDVTPLRCVSYLLKLDETERRHVGTDGNVFGVAVL